MTEYLRENLFITSTPYVAIKIKLKKLNRTNTNECIKLKLYLWEDYDCLKWQFVYQFLFKMLIKVWFLHFV